MNEPLWSEPHFSGFNPRLIPYQSAVIDFLDTWDYSNGTPEVLLSGSYGSAKSILMAHLIVRHCIENPGARVCLARKALPDLKDTIYREVLTHMAEDFTEGLHYWTNETSAKITWWNGSEILSRSWSDKKYKKGRSLNLSMLVIEELTENNDEDKEAFMTLKARLRRIPTVKENIFIAATNPDSPAHWAYKYWFESKSETRKVFKSVTTDNPFLDPVYVEQLKKDLDPKAAQRYIYGEWVELDRDRIYHAYQSEKNFIQDTYKIDPNHPICIGFDFNIGDGKPMSSCAYQFIDDKFHVFDEVILQGARTQGAMEAWQEKGIFNAARKFIVHGDAAGKARDTRSIRSDYEIIEAVMRNIGVNFEMRVPQANPPIRTRHNRVNAYCQNEAGAIRLYVYKTCPTLHDGMRLTALKKGGEYIEDEKPYQHVTTALGYGIVYETNMLGIRKASSTRRM